MTKLPPPPQPRREPFFQRKDWLVSSGLVLVLYVLLLLLMHLYVPGGSIIKYLIHLLPLFAAGMAWRGIRDRDELLARGRAIRAKRRHAEMDIKKFSKTPNPAGGDSAGEEKKK